MSQQFKAFRTVAAAKIAGVDRQWLNEAISRGHYTCAPSDLLKGSREFDRDDLLSLFIFGVLAKEGVALARAGHLACECLTVLRNDKFSPVSRLYAAYSTDGLIVVVPDKLFNKDASHYGGLLVDRVREFRIDVIRSILEDRIKQETSVFGDE